MKANSPKQALSRSTVVFRASRKFFLFGNRIQMALSVLKVADPWSKSIGKQ